jgi:outer membrane protein TolC
MKPELKTLEEKVEAARQVFLREHHKYKMGRTSFSHLQEVQDNYAQASKELLDYNKDLNDAINLT